MGEIAILGMVFLLVLVQLWRLVLARHDRQEAAGIAQETRAATARVEAFLYCLVEHEKRKEHARSQLRTLVKGEGRTLLRERLKAHLGG